MCLLVSVLFVLHAHSPSPSWITIYAAVHMFSSSYTLQMNCCLCEIYFCEQAVLRPKLYEYYAYFVWVIDWLLRHTEGGIWWTHHKIQFKIISTCNKCSTCLFLCICVQCTSLWFNLNRSCVFFHDSLILCHLRKTHFGFLWLA